MTDSALDCYLAHVNAIPRLTKKEDAELAERAASGDEQARNQLIDSHLRFVVELARDFLGITPFLSFSDLISEGNLGLIVAAQRYRPGGKACFAYYAAFWVRSRLFRAIQQQARDIRLPQLVWTKLSLLRRAAEQLTHELGRPPTEAELAVQVGIPESKVSQLFAAGQNQIPLEGLLEGDDPHDRYGPRSMLDKLADPGPSPYENLEASDALSQVRKALSELPGRERAVLERRYGFSGAPQTLEAVGLEFGCTGERMRQLEVKALGALRRRVVSLFA